MSSLDSHNNLMLNAQAKGMVQRLLLGSVPVTSAATATSGRVTGQRVAQNWNLFGGVSAPVTLGVGVNGAFCTYARLFNPTTNSVMMLGVEYLLGTLVCSASPAAGTFTQNNSMPTKIFQIEGAGVSLATAAMCCYVVGNTTIASTIGNLSFTYTNQVGTAGQTGTMVLPAGGTNMLGAAFDMIPHLAAGDTGVRAITAASMTVGGQPSSGTFKFYGVIPIAYHTMSGAGQMAPEDPLAQNLPVPLIEAGDLLALYRFGVNTSVQLGAAIGLVADA